jgi:CheY-like chemotaxis protein
MATQSSPQPIQSSKRVIILLIEDEVDVRQAIAELLVEHGYEVLAAANGREAIAVLDSGCRPSLILLDLMMPILNGWNVLDVLAGAGDLSAIPLVIMSAFENTARTIRHAQAFLPKPLKLASLLATVEKYAVADPVARATFQVALARQDIGSRAR